MPDVRPLNERINGKRIKPGQQSDAKERLIFDDDDSLIPAYVKKFL
jgi:hypothetical protein